MNKSLKYLLALLIPVLSSQSHATSLVSSDVEIHWDSFTVSVLSGGISPTLAVFPAPTFDYASIDSTSGSVSTLLPAGTGVSESVISATVEAGSSISPFDPDGIEALPAGTPTGSIFASANILDAAIGGEIIEIETNRTIAVTAAGAGTVMFSIDYTLGNFVAGAAGPLSQAIARATLGRAEFSGDSTGFTLIGSTAAQETIGLGFDTAKSLSGTLDFVHTFADGELLFLATNALTTVDNVPPTAPVPVPAPILLLASGWAILLHRAGRRKAIS